MTTAVDPVEHVLAKAPGLLLAFASFLCLVAAVTGPVVARLHRFPGSDEGMLILVWISIWLIAAYRFIKIASAEQ